MAVTDPSSAARIVLPRLLDRLAAAVEGDDAVRTLEMITQEAVELVGADRGASAITLDGDWDGASLSVLWTAGDEVGVLDVAWPGAATLADLVAREGRAIRLEPPVSGDGPMAHVLPPGWEAAQGVVGAPIGGPERVLGLLVVADPAREPGFGDEDLEVLAGLGRLAGSALRRAAAAHDLAEADKRRHVFFGVLSHELRTPITTIYGGSRVLKQSGHRLSHDARQQLVDDIAADAERVFRLIEDLLVLSRAERDGLDAMTEPVLIQHVLHRVVSGEQQRWPRARFQLTSRSDLPPVAGDETFIDQVIRNLLSNAAKYASGDGPIEIVTAVDDLYVEVRVLDQGDGVGQSDWSRLFDLFYRGPDAPARAQGAGIGLYACRALVRAMEGEIWARPRPTRGAEFGFRLRIHRDGDDDPEPRSAGWGRGTAGPAGYEDSGAEAGR